VPFAIAGTEGFGIVSADGASRLITHWLLQSDLRAFLSSHSPTPDRETFLLRFGGMRLDATLERSFRAALFVNLAQNQVFLLEGWIEASLAPGVQLRAGKILYPISEERLTPGINLPFVSTSVAAMLLPARDTGVELFGSLAGDRIFWNLALTNGSVPGSARDAVADSGKDLVGRLYVHPFLAAGVEPLRKLGLGLGASTGGHNGTSENSRLFSLQSYGGQTFFLFATGAVASGRAQRVVPHLTWGFGPVSAYADAVWARDKISGTDVTSNAWCWTTSFVAYSGACGATHVRHPKPPARLADGSFRRVRDSGCGPQGDDRLGRVPRVGKPGRSDERNDRLRSGSQLVSVERSGAAGHLWPSGVHGRGQRTRTAQRGHVDRALPTDSLAAVAHLARVRERVLWHRGDQHSQVASGRRRTVITSALTNPTVKAAIEALQRGDRSGWSALFESDARLYDDGSPRSLEKFTREGVGHERFTSIDRVDDDGLSVVGRFHSDQWGDFRTYFRFRLAPSGKIARLDIGQAK